MIRFINSRARLESYSGPKVTSYDPIV